MEKIKALLLVVFPIVALLSCGLSSSNAVPAFLWSSHRNGPSSKEVVNYRTISSRELAHIALSEGGWLSHVCHGEKLQQDVDVVLVFLGKKLESSDLSQKMHVDQSLISFLEQSFTSSNFSMALPYVTKSNENERIENSLITAFSENCKDGLKWKHIAISEACSVNGDDLTKLTDLNSVQEYISSNSDSIAKGEANVIMYCDSGESVKPQTESVKPQTEGEVLAKLISFMKKLGLRYSILYASDPLQKLDIGAQRIPYRSLAEGTTNTSVKSGDCDGVCQIKSSLLEGLFVAIVLLIILISGLCCMMGIDTPSRFETPQES